MAKYADVAAALADAQSKIAAALTNTDTTAELITWRDARKEYAEIQQALAAGGGGGSSSITSNSSIEYNAGVTTAKTQRVAIANDANTVTIAGGTTATPALVKRVTFTRGANTTSYAVDDQWGDLRQLTSFGQANQGYLLTEVNLVSSLTTLPTGYGSFSLFLFKNSTDAGSGIADNDPMTRRTTAMHSTGISLSTVAAKAANDISCSSFTGDLRNQLVLEGTDIWLRLMTRAAITTPAAAADTITLDLRFVGI